MPSHAVLVIDVQVGLIDGAAPVYDGAGLIGRIRALTDRARTAHTPLIYIQDNDVGPIGSSDWRIHPGLAPTPDDLTIRKPYSDSFYQTDLKQQLDARGVTHLVIAGCKTDVCVDATCRRAVSLGYDVTLVADGHSTTDNSFLSAAQSIAYYNLVLDGFGLEDGFGCGVHAITVCPADAIDFAIPALEHASAD